MRTKYCGDDADGYHECSQDGCLPCKIKRGTVVRSATCGVQWLAKIYGQSKFCRQRKGRGQ